VFYGLRLFAPDWFYLATAVSCASLAFGIGSTWATAGTIGVGLVGLATLVGVSPMITAGAVISGTFFGAKLSPLSPSTVLVAEITGNTVYSHLRHQARTSRNAVTKRTEASRDLDSSGSFADLVHLVLRLAPFGRG